MPRPDTTSNTMGGKSLNPFSAWRARRKEAKMAAEEEVARKITNDTARNEAAFLDTLSSIDFLHSPLPKEVLEAKADPDRKYGDLEFASRALQQLISRNPQTITVDLRQIDERLLTLAILFKQSIEQGDERAAFAAKAGLVHGFTKVRPKVPANQPELSRLFVETNAKYLESWITLVGLAQAADREKQNVDRLRDLFNEERDRDNADTDALYELLKTDPEFAEAFNNIIHNDSIVDRSRWNDKEREAHGMMIERRMGKARLDLKNFVLAQGEDELASKINQVEVLYVKVAKTPIVTDPNLFNKYREQIDLLFQELAASDAEIDEGLTLMDDIEGRIEQLSNAPGSVRMREEAAMEAEKAIEEIRRKQLERAGILEKERGLRMRELGLYSEEELHAMQEQLAEEEARQAEQIQNMIEVDQDQGNYILN